MHERDGRFVDSIAVFWSNLTFEHARGAMSIALKISPKILQAS